MKHRFALTLLPALVGIALLGGCASKSTQPQAAAAPTVSKWAMADVHPSVTSATQPSWGRVTGSVTFTQEGPDVRVVTQLEGFEPNTTHGFHIHDKGDLHAADLSSAGGHYNPTHDVHGGPDSEHHHMGDLGNLKADARGFVTSEHILKNMDLNNLIGRSVIIHAKADDLTTNPAGNSGARIAGGVIEVVHK